MVLPPAPVPTPVPVPVPYPVPVLPVIPVPLVPALYWEVGTPPQGSAGVVSTIVSLVFTTSEVRFCTCSRSWPVKQRCNTINNCKPNHRHLLVLCIFQLTKSKQYKCQHRCETTNAIIDPMDLIRKLTCWSGLHNKLLLYGVVLTNVSLDLLDDRAILNL